MRHFLDRYLQGECKQVWDELLALGEDIRKAPLYEEAEAIAHETMRRVRHNIELLIPRLQSLGYQFGYEWLENVDEEWRAWQPALYTPPSDDIVSRVIRFEESTGPLPLSLRAFYLEVGEVNFVGTHPDWIELLFEYNPHHLAPANFDPLYVSGLTDDFIECYFSWNEENTLYYAPIAPDYYLKYNASGDGPYEIALPDPGIDASLLNEWHNTTFVNYLRTCLYYGGLPGLERIRSEIPDELAYLRKDLLPI